MSQGFSPYSPQDFNSNASQSPWSPDSQTGSGYDPVNLPPINPGDDNYDDLFQEDVAQYFDSLPRLSSPPNLFLSSEPSSSRLQEQPPPSNQQARTTQRDPPQYGFIRYSESPDPFEEFTSFTPPRSLTQQHTYSRNATSHYTTRESSIVDLTESSPVLAMAPSRKRKADTPGEGRVNKTPRRATPKRARGTPVKFDLGDAEVVDLVDLDDDTQYEDFRRAQQEELIKQQQKDEANRPMKLAEFQCIVCMDNPTDLTVTHCGK
jgi:hypothetical protein